MSTACSKASTSNEPSGRRNFMRFSDARLQAESSTCMYSEHGFDALMRPEFVHVCQSLMIVSYWTPGSAHCHAASAIWPSRSRAGTVFMTFFSPVSGSDSLRASRSQSWPASAAFMNSSVTRTELLAFWYWIEVKPSPSIDMSKPASRSAPAFSSSLALHQMNSRMSGWSMSSTTIFAARRVLPPDLIVPAQESAPRMKETGPDAVPPLASGSIDPRMLERLMPDPEPPRKIRPSRVFQSRIDSIVSSTERMKQAEHCGDSSKPTLNHTGELNAAIWCSRMWVSSASNASPSDSEAKYPRSRPQSEIVLATRETICLTERSRVGELSCPRKYFWATMLVAFCDQVLGNSTSSCRKEPTAAVRSSHSTASKGWTPGRVNRRRTVKASAGRDVVSSVGCGVVCSISVRSPFSVPTLGTDLKSGPGRLHPSSDRTLSGGRRLKRRERL